ncbi:MAG: hypothetical protein GDA68_02520 [Nitrospira sp. CR2.1]|nr:hypothetical protein [Nitrospira sp. CR2.1]
MELERTLEANATSSALVRLGPGVRGSAVFLASRCGRWVFPATGGAGLVSADPGVPTSGCVDGRGNRCRAGALKAIRGEVDDLRLKVRGSVADVGVERVFRTASR